MCCVLCVVQPFVETGVSRWKELDARMKALDAAATELSTYFGEADKVKLEDLFKLFVEFMTDWKVRCVAGLMVCLTHTHSRLWWRLAVGRLVGG
jgi:hypothetical protein